MNPIYFLSCEWQIRCLFSLAGHSSDIDTVLIDISKNLWNLLGNESLLKTRGGIPSGPLALSVLKTLDNWLPSTSALALGSVNTSFPTLWSWTSVPSFLSFLMWPENLGVLVYGVVEKDEFLECVIVSWLIWTHSNQTAFQISSPCCITFAFSWSVSSNCGETRVAYGMRYLCGMQESIMPVSLCWNMFHFASTDSFFPTSKSVANSCSSLFIRVVCVLFLM